MFVALDDFDDVCYVKYMLDFSYHDTLYREHFVEEHRISAEI